MEIREIRRKEEWEGFLEGCGEKTFLQSWNWGEFQRAMREKVWRLGVYAAHEGGRASPNGVGREGSDLVAVALTVKVAAKRGTFLLVPHGPVLASREIPNPKSQIPDKSQILNSKYQILGMLLTKLTEIAKEERAAFVRINPIWERTKENAAIFQGLGFRQAPIQMHPEASWKLDLTPSEEQLFANFRKTTRNLIRQASKKEGVELEQRQDEEAVEEFSRMHERVSERQRFVPFSLQYLKEEQKAFGKDAALFFARYQGETAAAAFVVFWSGIGFYHHAASLPEFARMNLPTLLQWEAIQEAKRRGCWLYDFWGYVNPFEHPKHPWAGPTLFKMGFGGTAHEYVRTQDYPLKPSYWITAMFETMRKIRRHL